MKKLIKEITINVEGRVQAVFFRDSVKQKAHQLSLVGYTRNHDDGSVEIVAQGQEGALRQLLDWCYRGSFLSEVKSLSFHWKDISSLDYHGFSIDKEGRDFISDKLHAVKNITKNLIDKKIKKPLQHPRHIAIIPDGNRRWAQERGLDVWLGHKEGLTRMSELISYLTKTGVTHLTVWGFSTDNWKRNDNEVSFLLRLFKDGLKELSEKLKEAQVSFRHIGRKDRLPDVLVEMMNVLEEETKSFSDQHFILALDYGGKDEILRAINKLDLTKEVTGLDIEQVLDTYNLPDPDLIIRTSGEQRLSGLMAWQSTHSELYFSPVLFPDFDVKQLQFALDDFVSRKRRFGK